jgi:alanine dehydrogenase
MPKTIRLGLIREGKIPEDNRVAFTPRQCRWILEHYPQVEILVQPSPNRCFHDEEYVEERIPIQEDLSSCDTLIGIKEVPVDRLLSGKTYLMFSHTKKKQPYNQNLMNAFLRQEITLIDYECLTHEDGQRILGFGFFAGVVGAHNGLMAYGKKTGSFTFNPVHQCHDFSELTETYFGTKLPPLKIVVTGSGRVAAGILEVMGLLGIKDVPPEEFLITDYKYPVYTQLKGGELYLRKTDKVYIREDFHRNPENYECKFLPFITAADILINGIYWDQRMAPLFAWEDLQNPHFRIGVIADITNDLYGSVPCNLGDSTISDPVYGIDRHTHERTLPYLPGTVDMMCVGNLPNELPRDASKYFGEQLVKYVLDDLLNTPAAREDKIIERATIVKNGKLTKDYLFLQDYANGTTQPEISVD